MHPTQIQSWKKHFLDEGSRLFSEKAVDTKRQEAEEARLYEQIGKLQMQNDWLKKSCSELQRCGKVDETPIKVLDSDKKGAGLTSPVLYHLFKTA